MVPWKQGESTATMSPGWQTARSPAEIASAAGGDQQLVGADLAAGIQQQAGNLFAQRGRALNAVVIQAAQVAVAGGVAQGDDQRFHRRLGDIRHAAPQLDQALARPAAHQLQHLLPLRNVYRPLHRAVMAGSSACARCVCTK